MTHTDLYMIGEILYRETAVIASEDVRPLVATLAKEMMTGLTAQERLKANRVASVRLDAMVIGDVYGLAHDALVAQYASEPDGRERLASDFEHLIGEQVPPTGRETSDS